ncbi:MAG: aromatic ring-hydroxylating dioxygenase subunit alpha [Kastovskya adunca ATA6-11-RM4]|jgi:phenylpropionate dioxygenase-like ring-hydroxylating dioxygenase large terminal subunit|nr:aromatic ring-hydroxylating dioxygenase subunit alpha [Kastovskya adunca ATA6-11-RM4]
MQSYWYIACQSTELREKPLSVTILAHPLVVFRSVNNTIAALEDRCAHRNAPLSKGTVCQGQLECPYHGWGYGSNGGVTKIPALSETAPISENLCVKSYLCVEQDGYVWVCLAPTAARERPLEFPHLGQPGWTSFRMKTRFHAPVDACLENFLDCPHATYVHRLWFRTPTAKPVKAVVRSLEDGAVAEYFEEPREGSLVWWLLSRKRSQMQHSDRFIAPATSRVDYIFNDQRHYIITSSCTPIHDTLTEVYTVITFRFGRIGWLVRLFFEPLSRLIIQQDVKMLAMQQANIERFGGASYKFIAADLLAPYIAKWRTSLKTGSLPPPAGMEHQVDMRL